MILPKTPQPPTITSPRLMVYFGMSGVGKTPTCAMLPNHLLLDCNNNGSGAVAACRVNIDNFNQLQEVFKEIRKEILTKAVDILFKDKKISTNVVKELKKEEVAVVKSYKISLPQADWQKIYPYQFLIIDHAKCVQEWTDEQAFEDFKESAIGSSYILKKEKEGVRIESLTDIDHQTKWDYQRNKWKKFLDEAMYLAPHVILIGHVKAKVENMVVGQIKKVQSGSDIIITNDVQTDLLDLTGALVNITCAEADAVCKLYRENNKLYMSFKQENAGSAKGRFKYLWDVNEVHNWLKIYPHLKEEQLLSV